MEILQEISSLLQSGRAPKVKEKVQEALSAGISAADILENGLLVGMSEVGERFKNDEIFVPDVLMAARAMNKGVEILRPLLVADGVKERGTVVIGTVKGDQHDIGKNLVRMMLEGRGLNVIDLGVDVSADKFCETARENNAQIIACSALLTTTMGVMKEVVDEVKSSDLCGKVRVMIGGAPITQAYCDQINADAYTSNASAAAETAAKLCAELLETA